MGVVAMAVEKVLDYHWINLINFRWIWVGGGVRILEMLIGLLGRYHWRVRYGTRSYSPLAHLIIVCPNQWQRYLTRSRPVPKEPVVPKMICVRHRNSLATASMVWAALFAYLLIYRVSIEVWVWNIARTCEAISSIDWTLVAWYWWMRSGSSVALRGSLVALQCTHLLCSRISVLIHLSSQSMKAI